MGLKKFVVAVVMLSVSWVGFNATPAHAANTPIENYPDPVIPLMESLPFPWETIGGIWQARVKGQVVWYSFEVRNDLGGRKFLHVLQVDPATNSVVGEGNGFIDFKTNAVRAGMVTDHGSYMLFIGLYRNDKLPGFPHEVTMLTARDFQNLSQEFSVAIDKIVPYPIKMPSN